ncbi:DUF6157 family protein [Arthrobacter sp. NPDC055585]
MTTNYTDTFIQVAGDSPAQSAKTPPEGKAAPTIAQLQYELLIAAPYSMTSDDLLFEVHARRQGIADADRDQARLEYFAKPLACLRSSPLGKQYGWGIHHDSQSRVALVPLGSPEYLEFAGDAGLRQVHAMRSKRQ